MRMTMEAMKNVAKNIILLNNYAIQKAKRDCKCAEKDIEIEASKDCLESIGSAFIMLGLMTNEEFKELRGKRISKKDAEEIMSSKAWLCATAKTDFPLPFSISGIGV